MINEAIILAGGFGTRLKSVVSDVPKPMAPVNGKPFLYYLLNYLHAEGINRVILSVGFKHEVISDYFGDRFKSIEIEYSIEDQPLGTGGGIWLALNKCSEDIVFILNGDTFFPISLSRLRETQIKSGAVTTIALKNVGKNNRYGTVSLDEDSFIKSFLEKSETPESIINGGIYCVDKPKFLNYQFNERFSFEKDYLELEAPNHNIAGCIFDSYFLDIGIPDSLQQAQEDFKEK
jgi:D-glycero-alpha-D-manno-heptose 1-phosphate guanylyltransferase